MRKALSLPRTAINTIYFISYYHNIYRCEITISKLSLNNDKSEINCSGYLRRFDINSKNNIKNICLLNWKQVALGVISIFNTNP